LRLKCRANGAETFGPYLLFTGAHIVRRGKQESLMNTPVTTRLFAAIGATALSAVLLAGPAQAQQPLSRAEVRQQTLAAIEAGDMLPAGEGSATGADDAIASGKTRAQRKAETLEANRKGEIQTGGLGSYRTNMSQQTATAGSTKTRAERKAQTMQAIKNHQMLAAGEAA
jgi:hypothetical protein